MAGYYEHHIIDAEQLAQTDRVSTEVHDEIEWQIDGRPGGIVEPRLLAYRVDTVLGLGAATKTLLMDDLEEICAAHMLTRQEDDEEHCLPDDYDHMAHPDYEQEHDDPEEHERYFGVPKAGRPLTAAQRAAFNRMKEIEKMGVKSLADKLFPEEAIAEADATSAQPDEAELAEAYAQARSDQMVEEGWYPVPHFARQRDLIPEAREMIQQVKEDIKQLDQEGEQ